MIEIIVDEKTAREKLFNSYYNKDIKSNSIITPKNDEIRKYCEFLKKYYYPLHNKEIDYLDDFFVMKIDEETAFYFKLKYC